MTTPVSPLPDLFPYLVPIGVDIPDGTLRCREFTGGGAAVVFSARRWEFRSYERYFTAEPIPVPRPTPPTEPGTFLLEVTVTDDYHGVLTWERGIRDNAQEDHCGVPWLLVNGNDSRWFASSKLLSWTVADVTPGLTVPADADPLDEVEPDPMDEDDHRPRMSEGCRFMWFTEPLRGYPGRHWGTDTNSAGAMRLDELGEPVTFAPEVYHSDNPLDEGDHRPRIIRPHGNDACAPYGITRRQDGLWYVLGYSPKGYTLDDWQNKNGWTVTFAEVN